LFLDTNILVRSNRSLGAWLASLYGFCSSDNLKVWQRRQSQLNSGGDFVAFSKQDNGVLTKPKQVVDPDDALTPAEAKKVRHALKQIREGKTRPWSQIKHELGL
jgi:hypothetical protein